MSDARRHPHDLHANAWYLAFERLAGHVVGAVRGPHSARLYPPSRPHPDYRQDASRRLALTPDEIADRCLGSGQRPDGIEPSMIAPIHPDLAIEVSLPKLPRRPRQHYLLELEHSRHPAGLKDKLARYDALITGWARTQEPFLSAGLPPAVIFVFPDEPMTTAVAKLADALGTVASPHSRTARPRGPTRGASGCSSAPIATRTRGRCGRSCSANCGRRAAGGGGGLRGKPMPVGLVRREIIKPEVLELHRP